MIEPWLPGKKIANIYELERLLGRGGLGEVWRATDMRLGRRVAIKVILEPNLGIEVVDRFAREARLIAQLNHPWIIQIYDVGRENDNRYIVMEYVEGPNLANLINIGQINIGWALRIARQVAEALQFAHKRGIIHRDIKPSNILVDAAGDQIKLSDFGIAKAQDDFLTSTLAGTPIYMAPEQSQHVHVGPEADIYALGATLYNLFTGRIPRRDVDLVSPQARNWIPEAPTKLRSDIPKKLSEAILAMMESDPAKRLPLEQLIHILGELSRKNPFPSGETLEERAIERTEIKVSEHEITELEIEQSPTGFFDSTIFPKSKFFQDESVRYTKIQETLSFYREHLNVEYQSLLRQANMTYWLWLACVILGFLTLISGIVVMLTGRITEGIATAASTIIVYFIQRVFQQREDHYRDLAKTKNSHLEYGNQWLLIIQSIDSIDEPAERIKRQARLIDVLTDKLITQKPT